MGSDQLVPDWGSLSGGIFLLKDIEVSYKVRKHKNYQFNLNDETLFNKYYLNLGFIVKESYYIRCIINIATITYYYTYSC